MDISQSNHKMYLFNLTMEKKKEVLNVGQRKYACFIIVPWDFTLSDTMNILDFMDCGLIFAANSVFNGRWFHFYLIDKNWDFIKISRVCSYNFLYVWGMFSMFIEY